MSNKTRRARKGQRLEQNAWACKEVLKKTENNDHPKAAFSWKRAAIWVGSVSTALVTAAAIAIGTGVGGRVLGLIGAGYVPAVGSLAITESSHAYNLIVPVFNKQAADEQIRSITVSMAIGPPLGAQCGFNSGETPTTYQYDVDNDLTFGARHSVIGAVTPAVGIAAGQRVRATGKISFAAPSCGGANLTLTFTPPALVLAGDTTTNIYIALPDKIGSGANSFDVSNNNYAASGSSTVQPFELTATISFQMNSGAEISACTNYSGYVGC